MDKITNVNELVDWIYNNSNIDFPNVDDSTIYIQGACDSSVTIDFEIDNTIDEIIFKVMNTLESFDADNEFMELWSVEFAKRNHFKPSQFIRMLQEDEASFKELAKKLRMLTN
jgi:hypothetical protein